MGQLDYKIWQKFEICQLNHTTEILVTIQTATGCDIQDASFPERALHYVRYAKLLKILF